MDSTSLTKPVDLQGLSLALAKTKADYEGKIDAAMSSIDTGVTSVNGNTGDVSLNATDVGAIPSDESFKREYNTSTGIETLKIGHAASDGTQGNIKLGNSVGNHGYTIIEPSATTAASNSTTTIKLPASSGTLALTTNIPTTLSGLTDTTISSPANGQVLTYNSTSGKWENVAVPKEVLYGTVTISGTSATFSSAITGYAIASGNKAVIVRHSATGDIYKLIYFESESGICYFRFNCVTATSIKSISGSGNSSSSGTTALTGTYSIKPILDTNISSPSAGQVLQYDATNEVWKNATISNITYSLSINNNVITLTGSDGSTSSVTLPVFGGTSADVWEGGAY